MSELGGKAMKSIIPNPYELDPNNILLPNIGQYIVACYERILRTYHDDTAQAIARGYINEGFITKFMEGEQITIEQNVAKLRKMNLVDDESIIMILKSAAKAGINTAFEHNGIDPFSNIFYLDAEFDDDDKNHAKIYMKRVGDEELLA